MRILCFSYQLSGDCFLEFLVDKPPKKKKRIWVSAKFTLQIATHLVLWLLLSPSGSYTILISIESKASKVLLFFFFFRFEINMLFVDNGMTDLRKRDIIRW